MNRAASFRIQAYKQFTALNANVVAIDYRGFGDSHGTPTEEGLYSDARAAYRWIRERQGAILDQSTKTSMPDIFVAGQSLGSGVAARLTLDLVRVGT
jgi:abhydrolase domain-containing protein 12